MPTSGQLGCFDLTLRYDALTQKEDPLEPLTQHIPWPCFRKTLDKSLCRFKRQKGGVVRRLMRFSCLKSWCCKPSITCPMSKWNIRSGTDSRSCGFWGSICISGFSMPRPSGSFARCWPKRGSLKRSLRNLIRIWLSTGYKHAGATD